MIFRGLKMKKLRIYLDTSVINFLFADDAPDFKRVTEQFFQNCALLYNLYISDLVIMEIDRDPDKEHRQQLMEIIGNNPITILGTDNTDEIELLANKYIQRGVIPKIKLDDALHVAYATVHEMDILLSWNFKHLANINKEIKIQAINIEEGYRYPLRLISPLEVLDEG